MSAAMTKSGAIEPIIKVLAAVEQVFHLGGSSLHIPNQTFIMMCPHRTCCIPSARPSSPSCNAYHPLLSPKMYEVCIYMVITNYDSLEEQNKNFDKGTATSDDGGGDSRTKVVIVKTSKL
jgi:hypothetical protein